MASRRAVGLVRRFVAAAERRARIVRALEWSRRRRAFSSLSRTVAHGEYCCVVEPGLLLPSVSPWTRTTNHLPPMRQEIFFPWALQGIQKQHPVMLTSSAEEHRSSGRDHDDDDDDDDEKDDDDDRAEELAMNVAETRKILRQVNAVALKKRLQADVRDSFSYRELLEFLKESGTVANDEEAMRLARVLDAAGVVLIFRENVYIHPERVAKLVAHALPFAVVPANDPRRTELMKLEADKVEIDIIAHRQVRRYLWTGLAGLTLQAALFFRLTFWELSWDVMEPIAFFVTSGGLIAGYTYFLVTARDPSYQDFMQRLFLSKQMKLFKKKKFDYLRYQLLRRQCQCLDPEEKHW